MAGRTMRFRNPAGHAGLINNLVSLANSLAGFLEARINLFARESKTALLQILFLAAAVIGALVLLASGYVFLIVSIIFGIAYAAGVSWVWIALAAALLHFVLAGVCGFAAKAQITKPMFQASRLELRRDREWLKATNKQDERDQSQS
ncbi:MAG TPA: phage holin family protein [Chthoniobacterales bacterium]|nr:phage holin family protein [Chthoniobacterales bacterium]